MTEPPSAPVRRAGVTGVIDVIGVTPRDAISTALASLVAVAALWAVYVHAVAEVVPFDDAFVSMRYAENLVAGEGLVYNTGERVFGSSTPLYVLWLTVLRLVAPGDLAEAAVRANAIAFLAAAFLAGRLVRELSGRPELGRLTAAALLANPVLLSVSLGGMESFWFLSLLLGALLAAYAERPRTFGFLAGLTVLTRPEGIVLAPIALVLWAKRPAALARAAVAASLPLAIWTVGATLYFGSPIPQSVVAKSTPLYELPAGFTLREVIHNLTNWMTGQRLDAISLARGVVVVALLLVAAGAPCLTRARGRRTWIAVPALLGLIAIYGVANALYSEWYWPAVLVMALVVLIAGVSAIATARATTAVLVAVWLALITFAPIEADGISASSALSFVRESPVRRRVLAYRAIGESLERAASPGDVVAAPEFGALGASYRGKILDPLGLVSPEALAFLPIPRGQQLRVGVGAISIDFVEATQPEWIVALPIFTTESLRPSPWFQERYRVAGTVRLPFVVWDSRDVVIYQRADLPPPDPDAPSRGAPVPPSS